MSVETKTDERCRERVLRFNYLRLPELFPQEFPVNKITDKKIRYRRPVLAAIAEPYERKALLIQMMKVHRTVVETLRKEGFAEFVTPVLQLFSEGGNSRPFKTNCNYNEKEYCLRSSHQFPGKRLIAMGLDKVYVKGPVFRNEDLGPRHSFEFESLEAYYSDSGNNKTRLTRLRRLIEKIFAKSWYAVHGNYTYKQVDLSKPWPVLHWKNLCVDKSIEEIQKEIKGANYEQKSTYPPLLHIQGLPTSLCPLALSQNGAALNNQTYVEGLEVYDSYLEENAPNILIKNWENSQDKSVVDTSYLETLSEGIPPTTGMGLGIDRICLAVLKPLFPEVTMRDLKTFPFY